MSSKGPVLLIGLDGVHHIPHPLTPEWPAEKRQEIISIGVNKAVGDAKAAGWEAEYFLIDFEDKQVVDKVEAKLKEKKWVAVSIGGGVRFSPQLTWLLEAVTNVAANSTSPPPKLVFQTSPEGLLERLQHNFPDKS